MSSAEIANLSYEEREALKGRMAITGLPVAERLKGWYMAEHRWELTELENAVRKRWEFAKASFLDLKGYEETMHAIAEEFDISVDQARIDIRNMRNAFGDLMSISKDMHRQRAIQMTLKAYKLAEKNEDPGAMVKAAKAYYEAAGLDKPDDQQIKMESVMQERNYILALDPTVRNLLLNFINIGGGVVDASKMFETISGVKSREGFTDYETIPDESATSDDNPGTDTQ